MGLTKFFWTTLRLPQGSVRSYTILLAHAFFCLNNLASALKEYRSQRRFQIGYRLWQVVIKRLIASDRNVWLFDSFGIKMRFLKSAQTSIKSRLC